MADDQGTTGPDCPAADDEVESPVASTISFQGIVSVDETAPERSKTPVCYTSLLHQQHLERSKNGSGPMSSTEQDCYTNLLHKPPERSQSSSTRSTDRRRKIPSGLMVRGRVFYVRIRVPRNVQATIGRTHVWRSLGTSSRSDAIRKSKLIIADLERSFLAAAGTPSPEAMSVKIITRKPVAVDLVAMPVMTFADLFRYFHADPAKVRAPKTRLIYENLLWITSSVWGDDRQLKSIDRSACRELLEVLRWLPSNPTKRFPSLNAVQAAKMAKKRGLKSTLSPGSINGYMAKLRALMTFAVNEGWIKRNPATGLSVIDPVRDRDKRLPFTPAQLQSIFNAPIYRGCVDDEWHYATPGPHRPRRARFWIPLLALFTGMRLNEICQLDVSDVQNIEGVDCFYITGNSTSNGGQKRLKTASSERLIPIHPTLLAIGFMEHVAQRRAGNGDKLFQELSLSKSGYYSDSFSKWFSRFLAKAGASHPKTCFHSFRHCYRDSLRDAGVDHQVSLALGGWAPSSESRGTEVASVYGRGFSIQTLSKEVQKVSYQAIDLSHLYR